MTIGRPLSDLRVSKSRTHGWVPRNGPRLLIHCSLQQQRFLSRRISRGEAAPSGAVFFMDIDNAFYRRRALELLPLQLYGVVGLKRSNVIRSAGVVLGGRVAVHVDGLPVGILRPGGIFGLVGVGCRYQVISPSAIVAECRRQDLDTATALRLTNEHASMLSRALRLHSQPTHKRIAGVLEMMVYDSGWVLRKNTSFVPGPVTHALIASFARTYPSQVSIEIARLWEAVRCADDGIEVDLAELRKHL